MFSSIVYSPDRLLLTQKQIQAMFHITRQTVWEWRKAGMPHKKLHRELLFDYEEVLNWVNDNRSDHSTNGKSTKP